MVIHGYIGKCQVHITIKENEPTCPANMICLHTHTINPVLSPWRSCPNIPATEADHHQLPASATKSISPGLTWSRGHTSHHLLYVPSLLQRLAIRASFYGHNAYKEEDNTRVYSIGVWKIYWTLCILGICPNSGLPANEEWRWTGSFSE